MTKMPRSASRYVAFLRGINVGGNKLIKMELLRKTFEQLGLTNVKTILASGNVLFESRDADPATVTRTIEVGLEKKLGIKVSIVLRTMEDLERLDKSAPFKGITVTPATRLYVTFLPRSVKGKKELINVVELSQDRGTLDLMERLDREYGKGITTRNWNTIGRILKAGGTAE